MPVHLTSRDALRIFDLADIWAVRTGNTVSLVSANDHIHSRGSSHYAGVAVDLHSSDPEGLSQTMRLAGYRVLWNVPGHYGHVHVEPGGGALVEPRAFFPEGRSYSRSTPRGSRRGQPRMILIEKTGAMSLPLVAWKRTVIVFLPAAAGTL